jgi:putative spermidine/putrescine transport system substrate-binding protein
VAKDLLPQLGSLGRIGRRQFGALLTGATALGACPSLAGAETGPLPKGSKVVFASWGGMYQNAQKVAFCEPFSKQTGAQVIQDGPVDYAKYRAMVASGTPNWDVIDVSIDFLYAGIVDGLFETIDTSIVDNKLFEPKYVNQYGAPAIVWAYILGYSTTTYAGANKPQTWADLFDLKKFPGRRMLRDRPTPMLEIALLADGVPSDKLYPLDVDRGFKKLDTIKDQSIFWTTNSQSQQLLVDGEVVMGVINSSRATDSILKGGKLAISWKQHLQSVDYLVVSKGSRNRDAAMRLIAEMATPQAQAMVSDIGFSAPTVPTAFPLIKDEVRPYLPSNPAYASESILVDQNYWRDNLSRVEERWTAWKLA